MTLVLYRRRAFTTKLEVRRAMWCAFDTAVRRKPLARAADAADVVYGIIFYNNAARFLRLDEKGHPQNKLPDK